MKKMKSLKSHNKIMVKRKDINTTILTIKNCPHCSSKNIIKYGKVNGVQRYKCKNNSCGKTFIEQYNSPFRYSKKFKYMWKEYYKLMEEGLTIRQCAAKLNINIITAFFWRHRILNSLISVNKVSILKNHIELSKMIHIENFKGSREKCLQNKNAIMIVSAIDNSINITSTPVSKNNISLNDLLKSIYPKIHTNALMVAYQDSRLSVLANKHNCSLGKKYEERVKYIKNILESDKLNDEIKEKLCKLKSIEPSYSIKLMLWFKKFHGIATKYIEHYLNWYIYLFKINLNIYSKFNNYNNSYLRWKDIKKITLTI